MRHYFKPVLFVLGLLLFTFGCQKDDSFQTDKMSQISIPNYSATVINGASIGSNKLLQNSLKGLIQI